MDDSPGSRHVEWRAFEEETFAAAAEADKPLLLALVTRWSPEAAEMDETTYAEPRIAANINDRFVPVRVDADRNPHVRERYNVGGFPSTVFLTPEGSVLTGATALGVDGFREILDSVRHTWDSNGEAAGSTPRALREEPPTGRVTARIEEQMIEQLLATYDEEYGGWGTGAKFPLPRTVEFALVRARDQATHTLEAIRTHLLDTDGGFSRYSHSRDWQGTRREKLADENAAVVRALAYGYRYTGEESYREAAARGVEFLTTTLWTGRGVAASRGGESRPGADAPAVDETLLAGHNGLAVDALTRYFAYTDDETAARHARQARETVVERLVDDGCVTRYREDSTAGPRGLLVDQARTLRALTTSWSVLGEPGPAVDVAEWTLETLRTDDGALRDSPAGGAGLLGETLYPLDTAVEFADAALDLAALTGRERYREAAADAVAAFAGAAERMGVEVAHYATVTARLREPTIVAVGTEAGSDLHRAALRLADHEATVVPRASDETTRELPDGEAQLLVDGEPQGRASSPAALEALLTGE